MSLHSLEPGTLMQETSEIIKYCTITTKFSLNYIYIYISKYTHNIHLHELPASHLCMFMHIFIFFIIFRRHMLKCFTTVYSYYIMKQGHWDQPMSMAKQKVRMLDNERQAKTHTVWKNMLLVMSLHFMFLVHIYGVLLI